MKITAAKIFPITFMPTRKNSFADNFYLSDNKFLTIKSLPTEKREGGNFLVVRRGNHVTVIFEN